MKAEERKELTRNNYAWIGLCPVCGQGRQVISRENRSGKLYILCEDCEFEWRSPQDARAIGAATRDNFGESTLVPHEELAMHPWHLLLDGVK